MRLFLAIDLPGEALALLSGLKRHVQGGRPVPDENMHITLVYLGDDVSDAAAEETHLAIEAKRFEAPEITVSGIGHFGDAMPRAVWIGAGPKTALAPLHDRLVTTARRAGCDVPKRRYHPHVTLARFSKDDPNSAASLTKLFERAASVSFGPFRPSAFHLYQSHLGGTAPYYQRLASYPFSGAV